MVVVSHVYTCQQASEPYTSKMSSLLYVDYISKHVKQESPAISDSPSAYPFSLELVPVGPLPHHPQDRSVMTGKERVSGGVVTPARALGAAGH